MQGIAIYDDDATKIEQICDEYGVVSAEVIEALLYAVEDGEIKLSEWL